jgi:hypothetical protein
VLLRGGSERGADYHLILPDFRVTDEHKLKVGRLVEAPLVRHERHVFPIELERFSRFVALGQVTGEASKLPSCWPFDDLRGRRLARCGRAGTYDHMNWIARMEEAFAGLTPVALAMVRRDTPPCELPNEPSHRVGRNTRAAI